MSIAINVKKGIRPDGNEKVLSYAEEKSMSDRIRDFESELSGKEVQQGLSYQPKDVQAVEKWLNHYKKMKSTMGAQRFEGKERADAEMELKRIEQQIARKWNGRIPSYQELWITHRAGAQYLDLVQTWVRLNKDREYGAFISRWKYLRRRREPEDPNADNVLHLFDRRS